MASLLPHRFLFRYSFPVTAVKGVPRSGKDLLKLPAKSALPDFGELDAAQNFSEIKLAWNAKGLGVSLEVKGKTRPLDSRAEAPTETDGLQLWFDTRNTQNIHRASRFCHHFCLLPTGGGAKQDQPFVTQRPIARAREDAPDESADQIRAQATLNKTGYRLEAWFPAETLYGFDPDNFRELGFYYLLRDAELGEQYPSVGPEFPIAQDPSLWVTLELVD